MTTYEKVPCPRCDGTGRYPVPKYNTYGKCLRCDGDGKIKRRLASPIASQDSPDWLYED